MLLFLELYENTLTIRQRSTRGVTAPVLVAGFMIPRFLASFLCRLSSGGGATPVVRPGFVRRACRVPAADGRFRLSTGHMRTSFRSQETPYHH